MATAKTIEKELLECERIYWQALKDGDVETALQLTDFPAIVTGAQGVGKVDRDTFAKMMRDPSYSIHEVVLDDDVSVRLVNEDVAIVAYKVHERLTVEGKPVTLDAADSSTWVRRGGSWRCVLHTEAILGDPFGRDRVVQE